jgi:hypothetical protein
MACLDAHLYEIEMDFTLGRYVAIAVKNTKMNISIFDL